MLAEVRYQMNLPPNSTKERQEHITVSGVWPACPRENILTNKPGSGVSGREE